jgi:hypothetical protein
LPGVVSDGGAEVAVGVPGPDGPFDVKKLTRISRRITAAATIRRWVFVERPLELVLFAGIVPSLRFLAMFG